jgi:hypothetical protein
MADGANDVSTKSRATHSGSSARTLISWKRLMPIKVWLIVAYQRWQHDEEGGYTS